MVNIDRYPMAKGVSEREHSTILDALSHYANSLGREARALNDRGAPYAVYQNMLQLERETRALYQRLNPTED